MQSTHKSIVHLVYKYHVEFLQLQCTHYNQTACARLCSIRFSSSSSAELRQHCKHSTQSHDKDVTTQENPTSIQIV